MNEDRKSFRERRSIFTVETEAIKHRTSYLETLVHLVKGNVGPGVFAMGDAFRHGGFVVSLVLINIIFLICVHCEHMLVASADSMRVLYKEDRCADYAETVELCFLNGPERTRSWAPKMSTIIKSFLVVTQLGFCCVYLVFIAANIKQVLDVNNIHIGMHYLILIVYVPVLLISLITNLKLLMPVSFIANICMIFGLGVTLFIAVRDGLPNINERKFYTDPLMVALFFGTTIFAFEGVALVLPLKNEMKQPKNFESTYGVLNIGMTIALMMFIAAGVIGYMKWGEDIKGSLTLNLGNTIVAQSVKIIVALGVLLGYPLQFFIAIRVMLPKALQIFKLTERPVLGELLFRTIMVIVTLIIAEVVPALGLFISLIGSVCSSALALIFPVIIEWILLPGKSASNLYKSFIIFKDIIILIIGVLGFAVGTYMSIYEIYHHFVKEKTHFLQNLFI